MTPTNSFIDIIFSRMTIAYFSISGLDMLGALEDLGHEKKKELIDWIYSLQVKPQVVSLFQITCDLNVNDVIPKCLDFWLDFMGHHPPLNFLNQISFLNVVSEKLLNTASAKSQ